jgi:hypothetical protein
MTIVPASIGMPWRSGTCNEVAADKDAAIQFGVIGAFVGSTSTVSSDPRKSFL